MNTLNVSAVNNEQEKLKQFLEQCANGVLAEKINNGVRIEKDGKQLINKKDLTSFLRFACDEAKKQTGKSARFAFVDDQTVYGWAIHYFEEDSIVGELYNEDGTKYKPKPVVMKTETAPAQAVKPKPKPMDLFDYMSLNAEPVAEKETESLSEHDDEPEEQLQKDLNCIGYKEPCELEHVQSQITDPHCLSAEKEPDAPQELIQINDSQFVDADGVIHEAYPVLSQQANSDITTLLTLLDIKTIVR